MGTTLDEIREHIADNKKLRGRVDLNITGATVSNCANRAAILGLSYGNYVASRQYYKDCENRYFKSSEFKKELEKLKSQRSGYRRRKRRGNPGGRKNERDEFYERQASKEQAE